MSTQYTCRNGARRARLAASQADLNGIDYLEIDAAQQIILHFVHPLPGEAGGRPSARPALTPANISIDGGVRVRGVTPSGVTASGRDLAIALDPPADFSTYTLRIVTSPTDPTIPPGFDPQLSEVRFTFKIDCPADFDCGPADDCFPPAPAEPPIDYLAKDFASFRQLMLDRLSVTMPDWTERNPADVGVMMVELLAYAADRLSYYQDAVATEAYLGTARRRTSVRRHARLLDYPMHDGANARTFVQITLGRDRAGLQVQTLPLKARYRLGAVEYHTLFLTSIPGLPAQMPVGEAQALLPLRTADVFEPMYDIMLHRALNSIAFYTWQEEECCLPKGATRATLVNADDGLRNVLAKGDLLLFEEVVSPANGLAADADPARRHVVRVTSVTFVEDPLIVIDTVSGQHLRLAEIQWSPLDALPFALCISSVVDGRVVSDVSVARGNVVLADHGFTVGQPALPQVPDGIAYRPELRAPDELPFGLRPASGGITHATAFIEKNMVKAPASVAPVQDPRAALPAATLFGDGAEWTVRRDLIETGRFESEFVVEQEDNGRATLRFGDGLLGRAPSAGSRMRAVFRVGNGAGGNIGADAIAHVVTEADGIESVRNPLAAVGGTDPESIEQVRLYAPEAFRRQERAVTEEDYAAVAERHGEVQRAVATRRWTGSWYTMFITVDRTGGLAVDAAFELDLARFIDRFRLAGHDLEIDGPVFVPLDIALEICVKPGYFRGDVHASLLAAFSNGELRDGRRGFFHPDNFTFGVPVYLSQLIATAMAVPGVGWVAAKRFNRWREQPHGEIDAGAIAMGRLEIARLDNDPSMPENGRIEFIMEGGL